MMRLAFAIQFAAFTLLVAVLTANWWLTLEAYPLLRIPIGAFGVGLTVWSAMMTVVAARHRTH